MQADIARFIRVSPPQVRDTLRELRGIILAEVPSVEEAFKWRCPFYSYKGILCYLFGDEKQAGIGFCRGSEFVQGQGLLVGMGLKMVRHYTVGTPSEVDGDGVRCLLQEAVRVNELRAGQGKSF